MPITNFQTLHAEIKAILKAGGFKYIPIKKWYSFDLGILPTALANDCFTIRFPDMDDSTFESDDWGLLSVSVEFVLDSQNDLYLKKMDDACTAVVGLRALNSAEVVTNTDIKPNFSSHDVLDKILMTFDDIKLDIRSIA